MATSSDEREAYERLQGAIDNLLRVKGFIDDDPPLVLTDWIVFTASSGYMADGDAVTGYAYLLANEGNMPLYRAIGLAKVGTTQLMSTLGDGEE